MKLTFSSTMNIMFVCSILLCFVLFIVFLILFHDNYQKKISLKVDLSRTASKHVPFFNLYKDYRKIRHDFANYVQSIQLIQDDDSRQERKKIKKAILEQINVIEKNINKYIKPAEEDCL